MTRMACTYRLLQADVIVVNETCAFCGRHSMLPRQVQRLGRDWIAHWNGSQILTLNSPVPSYVRWAGHYPWASLPLPVPADFSANWRLPPFFGPWRQFQNSNWQLENIMQSSCFHLPGPSMKSEREEPLTKRRRVTGQCDTSTPEDEISLPHQETLCLSVAQNDGKHSSKKGKRCPLFISVVFMLNTPNRL